MSAPESQDMNRFSRARQDHARELAEDYVELIEQLEAEFGTARTVELAHRLEVSQPTVTKALGRLEREGLIVVHPRRHIELTQLGREMAERSRQRHEIVVQFLESLGVPPEQASLDAEGIEHHVSEATISAMIQHLQARAS